MEKELKDHIKAHFDSNPEAETMHITKDGQCFLTPHSASNHAISLRDKDIEEVKRADFVKTEMVEAKKTLVELIDACTTVEEVDALIKKNTPVAVKEIATAKIENLKGNAQ